MTKPAVKYLEGQHWSETYQPHVKPAPTEFVVKVIPLFESGKRRLWYVCAIPSDVAPKYNPPANLEKVRVESSPDLISAVKRWSLAWSAVPDEARDMGARLHAFLVGPS